MSQYFKIKRNTITHLKKLLIYKHWWHFGQRRYTSYLLSGSHIGHHLFISCDWMSSDRINIYVRLLIPNRSGYRHMDCLKIHDITDILQKHEPGLLAKYLVSKVHGANVGSTWVLSAPDGPHVSAMNLAIWVDIYIYIYISIFIILYLRLIVFLPADGAVTAVI